VGPDVFAAFVPNMDNEDDLVRFIQAASKRCFAAPFKLGEVEVKVHSKAGIAVYPHDGSDADTLLRHAEAALRRAKESSTHSYLFYTEEMSARVAEKLKLEGRLRQAVAGEQFTLHYQPKVDLERKIVGVEALIRWQSPELGLVPPGQFISLLEETGLILKVGAWALSRAALDQRQWVEEGLAAPRIAVNVSSIQLRDRQFVAVAQKAIGSGNGDGSAPVGIDMEITESVIMENIEGTIHTLKALRELGISLAIDDFGTGYSSLAYLAKLPVQSLKIDRAFIASMHHDTNTMTLVSMIISLAHSLRLKVVAEGVETEEQAKLLRLLRCDEMQGYLFARPMPIAAMTELLRAQRK
jgi:EAL domain-containing protein (putative c-di-GMP-specific phosphodiesterase class I)